MDWGEFAARPTGTTDDWMFEDDVPAPPPEVVAEANPPSLVEDWGEYMATPAAQAVGSDHDIDDDEHLHDFLHTTQAPPPHQVPQLGKRKRGRPKRDSTAILSSYAAMPSSSASSTTTRNSTSTTPCQPANAMSIMPTYMKPDNLIIPVGASTSPDIQSRDGHAVATVAQQVLEECCQFAEDDAATVDDDYMRFHDEFLGRHDYNLCSILLRAQKLNIDRRVLQQKMWRLAMSQVAAHRFHKLMFENVLVDSLRAAGTLKLYIDAASYDETGMKVSMKADSAADSSSGHCDATIANADLAVAKNLEAAVSNENMTCKLLQCKFSYAMSVEVFGELVSFLGIGLSPLQVMGSGTSEVLKQLLLRWTTVSQLSKQFEMQSRVVCSDKAGYNIKTEKSLVGDRDGWQGIHRQCDIHCIATTYTRTLDQLMVEQVSGMIHASLALQTGESLNAFRECLREVIRERLVVRRGHLSEEALHHKELLLNVFFTGNNALAMTQRAVVTVVANGDWRNRTQVEHFIKPDHTEPINLEEIAKVMESALTYVFIARRPDTFPRHRWTGGDQAIDFPSRMECVHQLLSWTFVKFASRYGTPSSNPNMSAFVGNDVVSPLAATVADVPFQNVEIPEPSTGHAPGIGLPESSSSTAPRSQRDSHEPITAAQHAHDRRIGLQFVLNKPYTNLVAMRLVVEPLRTLLSKHFSISGEDFEVHQRSRVAQALGGGHPGVVRDFMVTIAAHNTFEEEYRNDLERLFKNQAQWGLVADKDCNAFMRSLVFKLLSRQGSLIWQLVGFTHTTFPLRMFRLLHQPEFGDVIMQVPDCVLDEWSKKVKSLHPSLSGPGLQHLLYTHAQCLSTNISTVEARHATLRRFLQSRNQTWSMRMPTCSAEWICLCLRKRLNSCLLSLRSRCTPKSRKPSKASESTQPGLQTHRLRKGFTFYSVAVWVVLDMSRKKPLCQATLSPVIC